MVAVGESHLPSPCTSCICTPEGVNFVKKFVGISLLIFFFDLLIYQANCASLRVTDCGRLMHEVGVDKMMRDDVCAAQCAGFVEQSIINTETVILSSRPEVPSFLIPPERGPKYLKEIDLSPPPQIIRTRPYRRLKNRRRPFRRDFQFPEETIIIS